MRLAYFKEYKFFVFSYLDIMTAVFLYVYVILRAVGESAEWEMASIAYILYVLRGFRFILSIRYIFMQYNKVQ